MAVEGTSLRAAHDFDCSKKTIVLENRGNYGSTYSSVDRLASSPYIETESVRMNCCSLQKEQNVLLEALPFVLPAKHPDVLSYTDGPFGSPVEYAEIRDVFFVASSGEIVKLPVTKTEIVAAAYLSNEERFYLYDGIKKRDVSEYKKYLMDTHESSSLSRRIFAEYNLFDDNMVDNFGHAPYLYPAYGMGSLCENISLLKAVQGCVYLVNSTLKFVGTSEHDEYKYKFECEYGTFYSKEFYEEKLERKRFFIRILLLREPVIPGMPTMTGNFIAYIEAEELVKVIGLDSRAQVCPEGTRLFYIIKSKSPVRSADLELLRVAGHSVLLDMEFETAYDVNQF